MLGPGIHDSAVAREPGGLRATIIMDGVPQRRAELLAVEERSLLLLGNDGLATVALERVRVIDAGRFGEIGTPLRPSERDKLRLLSRFPYGVPDGVLEQLLRHHRQQAPEEW